MIKRYLFARRTILALIGLSGAMMLVVVACGGDDEPTAVTAATAVPAATAIPAATAAPAATAKPAPTATTAPVVEGPSGTLIVALKSTGAPVFANGKLPYPSATFLFGFSLAERLGTRDENYEPEKPMLAKSWALAADKSEVIVNLRDDVPFHGGGVWGKMTADDVVFSYNDANVNTNPNSRWDDAGEIAVVYKIAEKIDDFTVRLVINEFQTSWKTYIGGSPLVIFSKKVFDEKGEDAASTFIATGPFEVEEWIDGDRIIANGVIDHWRVTPEFAVLKVLEVPENATRVSMMRNGEADISQLPIKDVPALVKSAGLKTLEFGGSLGNGVWFAGNYFTKVSPVTGESTEREGFTPDDEHPWIGNPEDPARNESARKVRLAMSLAIDRELINETILGGLGEANFAGAAPRPSLPDFKEKWRIPFDPDKAKELLAEAGYANGFSFQYYIPPDSVIVPEVGEAVAEMWRVIGLDPKIFTIAYTAHRPRLVDRTLNYPWFFVNNGIDAALGELGSGRGGLYKSVESGASPGVEVEFFWDTAQAIDMAEDQETRAKLEEDLIDWYMETQFMTGVVSVPQLFTFNPKKIADWPLTRESPINNLENITKVK